MKWIRVGGFGLGLDGSGRGGWAYVSTALPLGSRQRVSLYGKRQKTAGRHGCSIRVPVVMGAQKKTIGFEVTYYNEFE